MYICVLVHVSLLYQLPEKSKRGGKLMLAHSFEGFSRWLFGPQMRFSIMTGSVCWSKTPHLMAATNQEDRNRKVSGQNTPFKDTPQHPSPPSRLHLPGYPPPHKSLRNFEFRPFLIQLLSPKFIRGQLILKYRLSGGIIYPNHNNMFGNT